MMVQNTHKLLALCQIGVCLLGLAQGECPGDGEVARVSLSEAGANSGVSKFISLAQTADILSILESDESGPYHVFAPSDEVVSSYLEEFPEVASDGEQALSLLTYHIVENESCDALTGNGFATLLEGEGQDLDVTAGSVVDPNGYSASIIKTVPLKNGYLYVIDDVLSPAIS